LNETVSTAPENAVNPETLEVVPGVARRALEGWSPELASEGELFGALEAAFDYRGDITLTLRDGRTIEGYLFDRRSGGTLENSLVRVIPKDSREKLSIRYLEIAAIGFTGRDTAAGKSWEAWVKKYWQKRAVGEHAEIQPESLEG
jgi:hypothetical protein